jgi:hypothetical protein
MRNIPFNYRLSFLLPPPLWFGGPAIPTIYGCRVAVSDGLVGITGPSRQAVFEQAATLVRSAGRRAPPLSIAVRLSSPYLAGGCDSWSMIVGADVAFSPTAIDPYFPALDIGPAPRPPPVKQMSSSS